MSKLILVLFGILAGWLLSEENRELLRKKIQDAGIAFAPQKATPPAQPVKEEIAPQKAEEVFPDPLEKIKGIGPVIKNKLNDSGIFTFAQLAALSPDELEEIVGASIKRFTDESEIIRQAQDFTA